MTFPKSFKTAAEVYKINFIFPNGDKYGKHTFQLLFLYRLKLNSLSVKKNETVIFYKTTIGTLTPLNKIT